MQCLKTSFACNASAPGWPVEGSNFSFLIHFAMVHNSILIVLAMVHNYGGPSFHWLDNFSLVAIVSPWDLVPGMVLAPWLARVAAALVMPFSLAPPVSLCYHTSAHRAEGTRAPSHWLGFWFAVRVLVA